MILSTAPQRRGFSRVSASSAARGGSRWRLNKRCQLLSEIRIPAIARTCLCSVSFTRGARGGLRGRGRPRPPRDSLARKRMRGGARLNAASFPQRAPRERLSSTAACSSSALTNSPRFEEAAASQRKDAPSVGGERDHWVYTYTVGL